MYVPVESRVSRESALGHSLFLYCTSSIMWLFSDDTIAYIAITYTIDSNYLPKNPQPCKLGRKMGNIFHLNKSNVLSVMGNNIRSNLRGVGRYQKDNQNTLYGHLHESFEEAKYLGLTIRQDLEWKRHVNNAPHEDQ